MTRIPTEWIPQRTKFKARYHYRGKPVVSVTQIIEQMGLRPDLSQLPPDMLREAGDRGTRVHAVAALLLKGKSLQQGMLKREESGYRKALEKWIADFEPSRKALVEQSLCIPSPVPHGGTLDYAGRVLGDRSVVVDFKTRPGVPGDGFQLVAYLLGLYQRSVRVIDRASTDLMGVELRKTGTYKVVRYQREHYERLWLNALELWSWRHQNEL